MQLWLVPLQLPEGGASWAESLLDAQERDRAARFKLALHRARFVAAHAALRLILSDATGMQAAALRFGTGEHGKPYVDGGPQFNLSHSGDWAGVAVANRPVGIDIELLDRAGERAADLLPSFADAERAAIAALPAGGQALATYRCWVRKESLLKAAGLGLGAGLDQVVVGVGAQAQVLACGHPQMTGRPWSMHAFDMPGRWAGAVAIEGPMPRVDRREWRWP